MKADQRVCELWCGRIDRGDTSVAQPHSTPTEVDVPAKRENRPARCFQNPDVLALS